MSALCFVLLSLLLVIGAVRGGTLRNYDYIYGNTPPILDPCNGSGGYSRYPETGSCYRFHNIGATWVEAKMMCRMEGADLAIIDNKEEADILVALFPAEIVNVESKKVARVGLRQITYKKWMWDDGSPLSSKFAEWPPGEPNNDKVNLCGSVNLNGKIDDVRCNNHVAFICEAKIDNYRIPPSLERSVPSRSSIKE